MSNVIDLFSRKIITSVTVKKTIGASPFTLDYLKEKISNLDARFGNDYPKDGITVKRAGTIKDGTLYLDSYGRGDCHNSQHCTNYVNRNKAKWNRPMPCPVDPDNLSMLLDKAYVKNVAKVVFGVKSDPFMWMDQKYEFTKYILYCLKENVDAQVEIFTRSDLVAHDDYITLMGKWCTINMYIPKHQDEDLTRIEEPGAPSVKRRMIAVDKLKSLGFKVNVVYTQKLTAKKNKSEVA